MIGLIILAAQIVFWYMVIILGIPAFLCLIGVMFEDSPSEVKRNSTQEVNNYRYDSDWGGDVGRPY